MPDNTHLKLYVAGSAFFAGLDDLQPWKPLLSNADAIALIRGREELVRVELGGQRRWIAFNRIVGGCPLYAIGYQETVGAVQRGGVIIGGSNRKFLAWLHPSGLVHLGEQPGE